MRYEVFADIAFYNGIVITVNADNALESAVAVKDNKIIYVGDQKGLEPYIGENTVQINLNGRCCMPGFVESHAHFMLQSLQTNGTMIKADISVAQSVADILQLIKEAVKHHKKGEWIVLQGYDENKLSDHRYPDCHELDIVSPDNPVWCIRADFHTGICNSLALEKSGLNKETRKKYKEAEVIVDERGELTGLIKEEAFGYVNSLVQYDEEKIKEAFVLGAKQYQQYGITSVHDAGAFGAPFVSALQDVVQQKKVKLRIYEMIYRMMGSESIKKFVYEHMVTGLHTGLGDEYFRLGPTKIILDGAASCPSVYMKEPFSHDPSLKGIMSFTQEEMDEILVNAHKEGYQITAHAMGDKAVEMMINSIEKAQTLYPKENCRPRIEHCALIDQEMLTRIKKLGIIPISNPGLLVYNGKDYSRFYGDRINMMFANKSYIDQEIIFAAGSDAPCGDLDPMIGLWGFVARKDRTTKAECGPCQKIDILNAIRAYTYNGAYASFEEEIKGSIEVGKLADLVVLSENILESELDHIPDIKVDMTVFDGEIVYKRND